MTEHIDDKGFEKYLDGDSRVSRSYARLKELEPPESVDRAILEFARREVGQGSSWRSSGWNRWISSFSIAAVVTIAFSLVIRVELMDGDYLEVREDAAPAAMMDERADSAVPVKEIDQAAIAEANAELQVARDAPQGGGTAQADGGQAWDLPGERVDDDYSENQPGRTEPAELASSAAPVAAAQEKAETSGMTLMGAPVSKPQSPELYGKQAHALSETEAPVDTVSAASPYADDMQMSEEELAAAAKRSAERERTTKNQAGMESEPEAYEFGVASATQADVAEESLITVTGSRIQRVDIEGPSPVSVIDREDLEQSGDLAVAEIVVTGVSASAQDDSRQSFLEQVRENPAHATEYYENPEDWLVYIDELIAADRIDEAREEIEVFGLAYPDFELGSQYTF